LSSPDGPVSAKVKMSIALEVLQHHDLASRMCMIFVNDVELWDDLRLMLPTLDEAVELFIAMAPWPTLDVLAIFVLICDF